MASLGASPHECVRRALAEDLGCEDSVDIATQLSRDVTTALCVEPARPGQARLFTKSVGVLAGLSCAEAAFRWLDPECTIEAVRSDGDAFAPGDDVVRVRGTMRALLVAERTALNFVQRLSGVATMTRRFVDAVAGTSARIYDTRKTTPGLRELEKAAVVAGGGYNHRIGLYDQVLIKENHFAFAHPASIEEVVRRCAERHDRPVVVEARTVDEAMAAVRGGAGVVLLDNFEPGAPLRAAVAAVKQTADEVGRIVETEASGGVTVDTVAAFAACGVDRISVGALTHSAPAADLSLLVEGVA